MPPKARPHAPSGTRRSQRAAAPTLTTAMKRRRPLQTETSQTAEEPPKKKRGRPPKQPSTTVQSVPSALSASAAAPTSPKKRPGRPRKQDGPPSLAPAGEAAQAPATAPKKRPGRPRKNEKLLVAETPTRTYKRGRPAKKVMGLDSSLIRCSSRLIERPAIQREAAEPTASSAPATPTPRMNPRMRSKLRKRLPSTRNIPSQPSNVQPARRGRPPKLQAAAKLAASTSKTATGAVAGVARDAKRSKPIVLRKPRGHTMLKVADKYASQVQQYYESLVNASSSDLVITNEDETEISVEPGQLEEAMEADGNEDEQNQGTRSADPAGPGEDQVAPERPDGNQEMVTQEEEGRGEGVFGDKNMADHSDTVAVDDGGFIDSQSLTYQGLGDADALLSQIDPIVGEGQDKALEPTFECEVMTEIMELIPMQQDGQALPFQEEADSKEPGQHEHEADKPPSSLNAKYGFVQETLAAATAPSVCG